MTLLLIIFIIVLFMQIYVMAIGTIALMIIAVIIAIIALIFKIYKNKIITNLASTEENKKRLDKFILSRKVYQYIYIDEKNKLWCVPKLDSNGNIKKKYTIVYAYSDLINFRIQENGKIIYASDGLSKTIVASNIAAQRENANYSVQITVNDMVVNPNINIKVESLYIANEINAILQLIQYENESINTDTNTSITNEIKKYKELLDIRAITEEEFELKKKELLKLERVSQSNSEELEEIEEVTLLEEKKEDSKVNSHIVSENELKEEVNMKSIIKEEVKNTEFLKIEKVHQSNYEKLEEIEEVTPLEKKKEDSKISSHIVYENEPKEELNMKSIIKEEVKNAEFPKIERVPQSNSEVLEEIEEVTPLEEKKEDFTENLHSSYASDLQEDERRKETEGLKEILISFFKGTWNAFRYFMSLFFILGGILTVEPLFLILGISLFPAIYKSALKYNKKISNKTIKNISIVLPIMILFLIGIFGEINYFKEENLNLTVGQNYEIDFLVKPENYKIVSSNENVVVIEDDKLKTKKNGTATIELYIDGEQKDSIEITVEDFRE